MLACTRPSEVPRRQRCVVPYGSGGKDGSGLLGVQYEVLSDGRVSAGCAGWVFRIAKQVAVKTWRAARRWSKSARMPVLHVQYAVTAVPVWAQCAAWQAWRAEVSWRWLLQVGGHYVCLHPT